MLSWTAPTTLPPDCTVDMLRDFAKKISASLTPAPESTINDCLKALAHGTAHKTKTTKDWNYQTKLYMRTIDDVPVDIWLEVTKELLKTYEWFPGTAAIAKRAEPILVERRKLLERANATLEIVSGDRQQLPAPTSTPKFNPTAARDRLRKIMDEQRTKPYADESYRFHDMANTERALALEERRPMADWAQQYFDDRVAAQGGAATDSLGHHAKAVTKKRDTPTSRRVAELAAARCEGRPPARRDEPPPPGADDFVVGNEFERGESADHPEA